MVIFVIAKRKERMMESGQNRILVPMKVNGLGSATHKPHTMVILLSPLEKDKYTLPNGEQMIFPVGVPAEMSPIYFARMTENYSAGVKLPELSHFYELISETKLLTLNIYQGKYGARPYLVFKDRDGNENSFRIPLPNGLITALNHNLPILMEEKLLKATAALVRINREEVTNGNPNEVDSQTSFAQVAKVIEAGDKPEVTLSDEVLESIDEFTSAQRKELLALAIENENYEWASILKEMEEDNG